MVSDMVARWPGSVHGTVQCPTTDGHTHFELRTTAHNGFPISDGGYPCQRYLTIPVLNTVTNAQKAYNAAHVSARNCIHE